MRRFLLLCAAAVAMFAGLSPAASAATKTWIGPSSGGNWSIGPNWSPSGAPVAGDTVVFNSTVTSNADLGAVAIGAIVFGPTFGGSVINGAVTINGVSASYNIDDQNTTATANTINATVALTGTTAYFRSQNATRTLKISGAISGNFGVRVYGPGNVDFSGPGDNTYTGATTVMPQGALLLSGAGFKMVPGDLFIGDGTGVANSAKVRLTSNFSDLIADTTKVTIASDGQLDMGIRSDTIAQLSGTGSVTMSGSNILTVGDSGNFTFGGVISGTGNVNKVDTGSMTYTAANTYTGLTSVSRGTLILATPDNVRAIATASPINIGAGTGTLGSNAATLRTTQWYQLDRLSGADVTVRLDGRMEIGGRDDLGALAVNGGNVVLQSQHTRVFGVLNMTGGRISGAGRLTPQNGVVATATPTLGAAVIDSSIEDSNGSQQVFTVNSGSTQPELTINGSLFLSTANNFAPFSITKTGTGTLRLAGSDFNSYANANGGSTTVERGVLELGKPDNVSAITGPIVIGNNTDPAGSAVLRNLATQQIGDKPSVTINSSGVYDMNSASQIERREWIGGLSGTGSLLMPSSSNLIIEIPSGSATFGGALSSQLSATSLIQKSGVGEQIFTGNGSAYVASASVHQGRLTVNSPGVLGSRVEIDNGGELGGTGQVGTLTVFNGGRVRPGNGSGGALSVGATLFVAGSSLVIDATNTNVGRLNVTGSVTIDPTAVLDLRGVPTFSVAENNFATFISNDGADAIQGTFRGLPEGRSAPVGPRNVTISYVGGDGNDATLTVRKTLDIDGDSQYFAETDGLLIRRFIQNLTGPALIANAVAPGARRTTDADILAYLQSLGSALDVNNSVAGAVDATDALLINRWMLGFRGESLVSGTATPPNFGDRSLYIANTELTLRTVMP